MVGYSRHHGLRQVPAGPLPGSRWAQPLNPNVRKIVEICAVSFPVLQNSPASLEATSVLTAGAEAIIAGAGIKEGPAWCGAWAGASGRLRCLEPM